MLCIYNYTRRLDPPGRLLPNGYAEYACRVVLLPYNPTELDSYK